MRLNPLIIYATALIALLLWPFFLPGFLGLRDMVILDHPALTESAFGLGDTPARNAPQDGFLALIGTILPAGWVARVLILGSAALGAYLATLWVKDPNHQWQKAAAITLTLWNPFVIERLLQGHWSLVMAAWLLPGIAVVTQSSSKAALVALCSLTPTGLVLAILTALWTSPQRWRNYGFFLTIGGLLSLPWLVPSVLTPPLKFGTAAFVARAEAHVGTVGSLLGLGGIWNQAATPDSRNAGFAVFGVALFFILTRWMPKREGALAALGLICCLFMTFGPVEWVTTEIPGAALFRDSHKLIILMLPAMVAAASRAGISHPTSSTRTRLSFLPAIVLALAIMQAPDAPLAMRALTPHTSPGPWQQLEGTTLNADSAGLIIFNNTVMVDPWTKATDTVAGGELRVDGETVDSSSDAYYRARESWENKDLDALTSMGINGVISQGKYHYVSPPSDSKSASWWLGISLTAIWLAVCLCLAFIGLRNARRTIS